MQKVPLTPGGHKKMQEELRRLLKVERPGVVVAIAEARAHGDLSENAEYHAAKEKQSFIEGRIAELKDKLARAQVIDPARIKQDNVAFGAKVTVLDVKTEKELVFTLVGSDEADAGAGLISISSPVGRALIGKVPGDVVVIRAPARTIEYEVMEIEYS